MVLGNADFREKLSTSKFLIVDDEPNFLKTLKNILGVICKFKVEEESIYTASNAKDTLRVLMQNEKSGKPVDMVLLDIHMPVNHGLDLLRAIRGASIANIQNVPVIIATGVKDEKVMRDSIFEGADGFILKPFTAKTLLLKMNPILRGFWSGMRPVRKKSKRKSWRVDTSRIDFVAEAFFQNGTTKKGVIIDMSVRGARLYFEGTKKDMDIDIPEGLDFDEDQKVDSISIPVAPGQDSCEFNIKVTSLPEINLNGFDEIIVPLSLTNKSFNGNADKIWKNWITHAREENLKHFDKSRDS